MWKSRQNTHLAGPAQLIHDLIQEIGGQVQLLDCLKELLRMHTRSQHVWGCSTHPYKAQHTSKPSPVRRRAPTPTTHITCAQHTQHAHNMVHPTSWMDLHSLATLSRCVMSSPPSSAAPRPVRAGPVLPAPAAVAAAAAAASRVSDMLPLSCASSWSAGHARGVLS